MLGVVFFMFVILLFLGIPIAAAMMVPTLLPSLLDCLLECMGRKPDSDIFL